MRKKEQIVSIDATTITDKQWSTLLIELNLVRESYARSGIHWVLKAPNIDKIIKWGKRRPSDNSSSQVSNERKSVNESKGNESSD